MLLVAPRAVRRLPAVRAAHGRRRLTGDHVEPSPERAEATLVLDNSSGLHARLAASVVRAARQSGAAVTLRNLDRDAGRPASAASIVALLALGAGPGDRLRIEGEGADAEAAVSAVVAALGRARESELTS